jgi:hypothetical protein
MACRPILYVLPGTSTLCLFGEPVVVVDDDDGGGGGATA